MRKAKASKKSQAVTQPKSNEDVAVKILLPAELLRWAKKEAYDLDNTLNDLVRDCLEYEKLRTEKECYTTCPRAIRSLRAMDERMRRGDAMRWKGGTK